MQRSEFCNLFSDDVKNGGRSHKTEVSPFHNKDLLISRDTRCFSRHKQDEAFRSSFRP